MSLTKEDLQAIKAIIKEETDPINNRLDKVDDRLDKIENDITEIKAEITDIKADITEMKADIEDIKEYAEITRVSANASVEWLRKWSGKDKPFPVDDEEIEYEEETI